MKTTVVTGLLGSGKTTFIKNLLQGASEKTVVLVNDFGKAGIDGEIFSASGIEFVELPSGCVCCTLKADLITTIQKIIRQFSPAHLVIEPSGVASPTGVLEALESAEAAPVSVVGIVDVTEFAELYESGMYGSFFEDQIRNAHIILVNKTDLADERTVSETEEKVSFINPHAVLYRTVNAVWAPSSSEALPQPLSRKDGEGGEDRQNHFQFETISVKLHNTVDFHSVSRLINDVAAHRYGIVRRAKALVQTDNGPFRFDIVFGKVDAVHFEKNINQSRVVVIGQGLDREALEHDVDHLPVVTSFFKEKTPEAMTDLLERQNKKLSILYEIALTVGKSLNLKTILDEVLEKVIAFMGVDAGVIYVIDENTLEMVPVSFRNLTDAVVKDLCERKVKVGECMCGTIAQCDEEVIILEKAFLDSRFTRGVLRKENMEFYAGLPLKARNMVVGVLCVITRAPYSPDQELLDILRAATQPIGLAIENARMFEYAKKEADRYSNFDGIITCSPKMVSILELVRKITDVPSSILIYGESGTGKELIARAIHFNSVRKDKPFIAVNCAALNENLLESELFGHVKGAFTGAASDKMGLFEAANGGTLFLDEVEAMSRNLQVKLLRVLQDSTFFSVGSVRPVCVDVRIIAATNQHLEESIKAKQFREDLYYRLNVIRIDLPPMRERAEDIPLLARYFLARFSKKLEKNVRTISKEAMEVLLGYSWPGNVRELANALEGASVITETEMIRPEDLPIEIRTRAEYSERDLTMKRVERDHIMRVLSLTAGNKRKAAKLLGLDVTTLWRKLKDIQIMA